MPVPAITINPQQQQQHNEFELDVLLVILLPMMLPMMMFAANGYSTTGTLAVACV